MLINMNSITKRYALIVAGGSGSRMQSTIPKQFLKIGNLPILMHTLYRFKQADEKTELIVVLPENEIDTWTNLCKQYKFELQHTVVKGGQTRFHSVQNGLNYCDDESIVAIHDGVRPFVSIRTILESYRIAEQYGNAVAAVPLKDSLRLKNTDGTTTAVPRDSYVAVQTPQTFQTRLIKSCFQTAYQPFFTDDASVAEHAGFTIHLINGDDENIKITTPQDRTWAETYLGSR